MKKLWFLILSALVWTAPSLADKDFAPFPLELNLMTGLTLADPPLIRPGVEYALNPCTFIDPAPGYICVPTSTGGFVIVPVGGGINLPDDLLGKSLLVRDHTTGLVADPDDLVNIPRHLWPYVRPVENKDFTSRGAALLEAAAMKSAWEADFPEFVTLPDGTSCTRRNLMCESLPGGLACRCQ